MKRSITPLGQMVRKRRNPDVRLVRRVQVAAERPELHIESFLVLKGELFVNIVPVQGEVVVHEIFKVYNVNATEDPTVFRPIMVHAKV